MNRWLVSYTTPGRLSLVAFAVFALCAPPGVWWRDAGQLTAAGYGLGIPHPTGFPTYMMLVKLSSLFPVGEIAFRVHLLSAACAAGAIGLCAMVTRDLVRRQWDAVSGACASVVCSLTLVLSYTFALHATTAEVYAPTALAWSLLLWLSSCAFHTVSARERGLMALTIGVGAGLHISFALAATVVGVSVLIGDLRQREGRLLWKRHWLLFTALGLGGLLVYVYLPLAAAHDPWRNWGYPTTLERVIAHMSGSTIRQAFETAVLPSSPLVLATHVSTFIEQIWQAQGWLFLLSVGGVITLLGNRERGLGLVLLGLLLVDWFFVITINPMGIEQRQTGVPTLLVLAVFGGVGAGELCARLPSGLRALTAGAPILLALSLIAPGALSCPQERTHTLDLSAELYLDALLSQTPPGARVLVKSDAASGLLSYALGVSGARPDLVAVMGAHLYDLEELKHIRRLYGEEVVSDPFFEEVASQADAKGFLSNSAQQRVISGLFGDVAGHSPVMWEVADKSFDEVAVSGLQPGFPLFTLTQPQPARPYPLESMRLHLTTWRALLSGALPDVAEQALGETLRHAGLQSARRERSAEALALLKQAVQVAPRSFRGWSNLGALLDRQGDRDGAFIAMEKAATLRPDNYTVQLNLARLLDADSDSQTARRHGKTALELATSPQQRAKAHVALSQIALREGDEARARDRAQAALAESPDNRRAQELLKALGSSDGSTP